MGILVLVPEKNFRHTTLTEVHHVSWILVKKARLKGISPPEITISQYQYFFQVLPKIWQQCHSQMKYVRFLTK